MPINPQDCDGITPAELLCSSFAARNPTLKAGTHNDRKILKKLILAGAVCSHNMLKQMLQSGERSSPLICCLRPHAQTLTPSWAAAGGGIYAAAPLREPQAVHHANPKPCTMRHPVPPEG